MAFKPREPEGILESLLSLLYSPGDLPLSPPIGGMVKAPFRLIKGGGKAPTQLSRLEELLASANKSKGKFGEKLRGKVSPKVTAKKDEVARKFDEMRSSLMKPRREWTIDSLVEFIRTHGVKVRRVKDKIVVVEEAHKKLPSGKIVDTTVDKIIEPTIADVKAFLGY